MKTKTMREMSNQELANLAKQSNPSSMIYQVAVNILLARNAKSKKRLEKKS